MKVLAFFTTTRAEFGAVLPLLNAIEKNDFLDYKLFVGGAHLTEECGHTVKEVEAAGVKIAGYFDYLLNGNSSNSLMISSGLCCIELSKIFEDHHFDAICAVGDRFEIIPICLAAILNKVPIIHLYGGEETEGVIDEQVRHMVTKASHIHFASCEEAKQNILNMGEDKSKVFVSGELVIDNMKTVDLTPKGNLFSDLSLSENKPVALVTFHPTTLELKDSPLAQTQKVMEALSEFDFQIVFTAPNIEVDADQVLQCIEKSVNNNPNWQYISSLGVKRYYSLLSVCNIVIGNSSSGIVEAPFYNRPSVNIGDRQKGRVRHESVIDVNCEVKDIIYGIKKASTTEFVESIKTMKFKFGDGNAAKKIVTALEKIDFGQQLLRKRLVFPRG